MSDYGDQYADEVREARQFVREITDADREAARWKRFCGELVASAEQIGPEAVAITKAAIDTWDRPNPNAQSSP